MLRKSLASALVAGCLLALSGSAEAKGHRHIYWVRHRRDHVVAVARQWTGIPYVYGGASSAGIDCSGLTMRVYGEALHIALPHSAAAQSAYGRFDGWKRVWKMSHLHRGDLLFEAGTYKAGISHVEIVAGGGRSVAATSSGTRSRVVAWSSYTRAHFSFGIRPPALRL